MPGRPCVLWPSTPENVYLTGDALHRLGQNSAIEYYAARENGNMHSVDKPSIKTSFWVLRAQATDKVAAAEATVSKPLAEHMVELLLLGGKDLIAALQKAEIFETGPRRLSTSKLELLFSCHCAVIGGELPGKYFRRCFSQAPNFGRKICTCPSFAQRGNCAHVWYISARQGQIDLATIPTKAKPGRKRCRSNAAREQGQRAKRRR